MTTFDFLLLAPIAYGAIKGFWKGLLLEVISLVAWFIGLIFGLRFLNTAIPVIRNIIGEAYGLLPFITFLVVFVLIIWGVRLAGALVKKGINLTPFGTLDNLLGGVLGGLKWCFGVSLFIYVLKLANISVAEEAIKKSVVYPIVVKLTPYALEVVGFFMPFVKYLLTTLKGLF